MVPPGLLIASQKCSGGAFVEAGISFIDALLVALIPLLETLSYRPGFYAVPVVVGTEIPTIAVLILARLGASICQQGRDTDE
jgi:hypothetical protein